MVVALAPIMLKISASGAAKAATGVGKLGKGVSKFSKSAGPQMEKLSKTFLKFGAITTGVFFTLIRASPRLQAEMEILNIRVNELLRGFGDGLAPVIRIVSDLVKDLTSWFKDLPEPVQDAITFAVGFTIVLGLLAGAFVALSFAMSPVTIAIIAIGLAVAGLHLMWTTNFGGIRDIVESVFESITPLFESITNLLSLFGGAATGAGDDVNTAFVGIEAFVSSIMESIGSYIENIITMFTGIVDFITAVFAGDFEAALDALTRIVQGWVGAMLDAILWPLKAIMDIIAAIQGEGAITDEGFTRIREQGIAGGSTSTSTTSTNIENVNVTFTEEQVKSEKTFLAGLPGSEGYRTGTIF